MMFAVDVCDLPKTGGSTFVVVAGLFVLVAGVIVARWVRGSAGRLSVVVAPLVLLGGLVLVPQVVDPCAPATTTVAPATTTVAPSVTTVAATNSTVPSATTTTVPSATTTSTTTTTTTVAPTTTTTTIALTCADGGVCAVGDLGPGGGIVFYDAGSTQPWGRYLEAACAGWQNNCDGTTAEPLAEWGCIGTLITGADGTAIGTGEQNTDEIMAGCTTDGIPARLAKDLVLGGESDWFLPSKDELDQMYTNLHSVSPPLGGFSPASYWSSSEYDGSNARYRYFFNGEQDSVAKDVPLYVRPVRAF